MWLRTNDRSTDTRGIVKSVRPACCRVHRASEVGIGCAGDRGARLGDVFVEALERRRLRLEARSRTRCAVRRDEVVRGLLHDRHAPERKLREMQAEICRGSTTCGCGVHERRDSGARSMSSRVTAVS